MSYKYVDQSFYKSDITAKIIQCAYRVHNNLNRGFQEVIYQRALLREFVNCNLKFEREKEMDVLYLGEKIGIRRVDFLIDQDIMVEIKALTTLEDVHMAQLMNYLEIYQVKVGLLLNFGTKTLQVRRLIK